MCLSFQKKFQFNFFERIPRINSRCFRFMRWIIPLSYSCILRLWRSFPCVCVCVCAYSKVLLLLTRVMFYDNFRYPKIVLIPMIYWRHVYLISSLVFEQSDKGWVGSDPPQVTTTIHEMNTHSIYALNIPKYRLNEKKSVIKSRYEASDEMIMLIIVWHK